MNPDSHDETNSHSLAFAEGLYEDFLADPASVPASWRAYFEQLPRANGRQRLGPAKQPPPLFGRVHAGGNGHGTNGNGSAAEHDRLTALQDNVDQFIRAYRVRGHMAANIDPLGIPREPMPELELSFYGFSEADLDEAVSATTIKGPDIRTLREILELLRNTYCRSIGVQFMHIDDIKVRTWLQDRMEGTENHVDLTRDEQLRILTKLSDAVIFEEFIQKKFVGAKSFSLEGAESLIPLLDLAIEKAGDQKIDEIVLGMAHRGRLNVLANIMGKSAEEIFREFEDAQSGSKPPRGDVKYHLGYSNKWKSANGHEVHLSLTFNPSHLEYVNTVAMGRLRAKQDRVNDRDRVRGMLLLIHGDAAFIGEGVVQETLNLSELEDYCVGGTLHVIVNNQVGFTTSPHQGRSSTYATDVAKMLQSPIFHVNGEDPDAVAQVVRLAMDFRREFKRDVVIDMYCFRRRGHNEGDEPSFTQPLMYAAMDLRKNTFEGYTEHLLKLGGVTRQEADKIAAARHDHLEKELADARESDDEETPLAVRSRIWIGYSGGGDRTVPDLPTGVDKARLSELLNKQAELPEDFILHPKLARFIRGRREMAAGQKALDWSAGEALAFATLATDKIRVRMTGQDAERGTFGHRHAVLHNVQTGDCYPVFQNLSPDQAPVEIHNSPLSEAGVLGFEYGYSLDFPSALVLWEAQFGDFVNAAQVILDQFIVSAEQKWRRLSGIVLLLPHGFEGQGPEHSSARLERFLQLCGDDNWQVVNCTTPANYFHVLRRQVRRNFRKPLVVMTPKSLLRHKLAVSALADMGPDTGFHRVIPDSGAGAADADVRRVVLCSGKVYYELLAERDARKIQDIALVRVEQLYPFPIRSLGAELARYPNADVVWCQEEPRNMGAWTYMDRRIEDLLTTLDVKAKRPSYVGRVEAASPATGLMSRHIKQQAKLIDEALTVA